MIILLLIVICIMLALGLLLAAHHTKVSDDAGRVIFLLAALIGVAFLIVAMFG